MSESIKSVSTAQDEESMTVEELLKIFPSRMYHSMHYPMRDYIYKILGDFLTIIDSLGLNDKQSKAVKDLAKERFMAKYREAQRDMGRSINESVDMVDKLLGQKSNGWVNPGGYEYSEFPQGLLQDI